MEPHTGMTRGIPAVVIGSGNVASCVVPALQKAGVIDTVAVYSPTPGHAEALAARLGEARGVCRIEDIPTEGVKLYLLAVKDDAVAELARTLKPVPEAVWLHTSGGVEASTLAPLTEHFGVFYPLQTFSKGVEVDLSKVPVFVEGADEFALTTARALGNAISPKVYDADGTTRCRLHAAAVFACNFTNHLWAVADDILRRETGTDLTVLAPLLEETMRKALTMRPADGQTGPARRGDTGVMAKHISLLTDDEARLYDILSKSIMKYYELD